MHNTILKRKQKHLNVKTSFWLRVVLIFFGLCLTLIIIETGLRIGGFIILSLQEYRNIHLVVQKGSYRILCLGESTTQGTYPPFLEEILNQRKIGIRFSVIDKGKAATNTTIILKQLELYLDKYHPNMVVAMMGVNDAGEHMPYEKSSSSKTVLFLRSFKTYKLMRLLWLHMVAKAKEIGLYKSYKNKQLPRERQSTLFNIGLEEVFAHEENNSEIGNLKKAVENNPKNYGTYVELGLSYRDQGNLQLAEECFKKALELNPKNEDAYIKLGMLYKDQSELRRAEECFKKVLELNPKNEAAYFELRWLCRGPDESQQVEKYLNKALELNPKNDGAYVELGLLYRDDANLQRAEECLKKALELNPKKDRIYLDLGWLYLIQDKFSQAEECFRKGLKFCHDKAKLYAVLAILYDEMGQISNAQKCYYKAEELKFGYIDPETAKNYRKLREVLDRRNIKLVCVQYPLRSIESLKKIFQDDVDGIIFVDNERSFKEAVKEGGYKLYFKDMFGGDFGHCTDKGNSLLAENIASVIFKEAFRK